MGNYRPEILKFVIKVTVRTWGREIGIDLKICNLNKF